MCHGTGEHLFMAFCRIHSMPAKGAKAPKPKATKKGTKAPKPAKAPKGKKGGKGKKAAAPAPASPAKA